MSDTFRTDTQSDMTETEERAEKERILEEVATQVLRPNLKQPCASCSKREATVVVQDHYYCEQCAMFRSGELDDLVLRRPATLPGVEPAHAPAPTPEQLEAERTAKASAVQAKIRAQKMGEQAQEFEQHVMTQAKALTLRLLQFGHVAVERAKDELGKPTPSPQVIGDFMSAAHLSIKLADEADSIGDKVMARKA